MIPEMNIDFSLIDQIEDPEQKEYFLDLKRRLDNKEIIDPSEILRTLPQSMIKSAPEQMDKLTGIQSQLSGALDALNKIKL